MDMTIRSMLFASCAGFVLLACGSDSDDGSGEELFSSTASAALGSDQNEARCSTCHANAAGVANNSGDSLKDIAFRTSFKGGGAPNLLAGTNACVTGWMGGTALTENDDEWKQLEAYLVSISDPAVTTPNTLAPEVLMNGAAYATAYAGGNAGAGAAKYAAACGRCHDGSLVVGTAGAPAKAGLKQVSVGRIAQKVRTSGPPPSGTADATDTTPGPMPFFEPDELSTQDLKDIIAHIRQ